MSHSKIQGLCFTALFSAIICVFTFIAVPLPIGYFNLGDVAILLSACTLSPLSAAAASALGSALADILTGYVLYAPATAVIKGCVAIVCTLLVRARIHKSHSLPVFAGMFLVSETLMVAGYFLYEYFPLGYGGGALSSVPANILQAVCCSLLAAIVANVIINKTKKI